MDNAHAIQVSATSNISLPTIRRYDAGLPITPSFHRRITAALKALGLDCYIRPEPVGPPSTMSVDSSPKSRA